MSEFENEFNEWKEDTRTEALEKELERLRQLNKNQSNKIQNLRKALYFQLFFVVSLFLILFFKGFIQLPGNTGSDIKELKNSIAFIKDSIEKAHLLNPVIEEDTLYLLGTPDKVKESEVVYSVQIGAFVGKDLTRFKSNLTNSIRQDSYGGINQISVGLFTKYNQAVEFLTVVQDMGFNDAFIMALKNGRRVNLQEILAKLPPEEKMHVPVKRQVTKNIQQDDENNTQPLNSSDTIKNSSTDNSMVNNKSENDTIL